MLAEAEQIEGSCKVQHRRLGASRCPNAVAAPINWDNLTLSNDLEQRDLDSGAIDPRIVGLLGAITQDAPDHDLRAALRPLRVRPPSGNVSNHYYGRAMDIAVGRRRLLHRHRARPPPARELGHTLAQLPAPAHPTELIYCYDVDGPGPAFAAAGPLRPRPRRLRRLSAASGPSGVT